MPSPQSDVPLSDVVALVLQVAPESLTRDAAMGGVANWDSMQQVVLMSMIEQTYGVRFTAEEIATATSVPSIQAALARGGVTAPWRAADA